MSSVGFILPPASPHTRFRSPVLSVVPADVRARACFQNLAPAKVALQEKLTTSVMFVSKFGHVLAVLGFYDEGYDPALKAVTAQVYFAAKPEAKTFLLPIFRASRLTLRQWAYNLLRKAPAQTAVIFGVTAHSKAGKRAATLAGFVHADVQFEGVDAPLMILTVK